MARDCRQCGKCCMSLGDYIVIEEYLGPYKVAACCVSTGTRFIARADKDKQDLFADQTWTRQNPTACPFLRPAHEGRIICSIHECSPVQCKAYRCVAFQVLSPEGTLIGTVTGARGLHTTDTRLRELWETGLAAISFFAEDLEEHMAVFLKKNGYIIQ